MCRSRTFQHEAEQGHAAHSGNLFNLIFSCADGHCTKVVVGGCLNLSNRKRIRTRPMAILDAVSLAILLGSTLMFEGILSSLVALRFGAPLLLVFLAVGMLAGEAGPGGIKFDDVRTTHLVGSIALALILFDGGLRTRITTFRSVLAPSLALATVGVLLTAAFAAPFAKYLLGVGWTESVLVGAVVALHRCRRGLLPASRAGLAAAPARRRNARGRIRHQRSVRDLSDDRADRNFADEAL